MIKIAICADNKVSERLKKYILEEQYGSNEIRLSIYQDSVQMLEYLDDKGEYPDLIFCDVTESSETLKNIRKRYADADTVILLPQNGNMADMVLYQAFAILTYPVKLKSVKNIIERYIDYKFSDKNIYTVTVDKEPYNIDLDNVYYFESRKRIIFTHGQGEPVHFYKTIRDLEKELLSYGFVRCHRSFLVNAKYVEEVHREYIIIKGEKIPVGRDYYEQGDGGIWRSLRKWNKYGAIIGVGGAFDGVIFRIKPEVEIVFGSDARYSDIVINDNVVGEKQAIIIFHQNNKDYSLWNLSNINIIINEKQKLLRGETIKLKTGDVFETEGSPNRFELG